MSDGHDPRHGPYRGKQTLNLEEWCHELTMLLYRRGAIRDDASVKMISDEVEGFATQVVRATRDGHFSEVPQFEIPAAALQAWKAGNQALAFGFVCCNPVLSGEVGSGRRTGCGSCTRCTELARYAKKRKRKA
jgi:hypothetical protein